MQILVHLRSHLVPSEVLVQRDAVIGSSSNPPLPAVACRQRRCLVERRSSGLSNFHGEMGVDTTLCGRRERAAVFLFCCLNVRCLFGGSCVWSAQAGPHWALACAAWRHALSPRCRHTLTDALASVEVYL